MGGPLGKEMFYHRFRTSAELCKAGLFIEESQLPSKKHRRLKCSYFWRHLVQCSFCSSIMSGWKDKFCQHLDKCKYAQAVVLDSWSHVVFWGSSGQYGVLLDPPSWSFEGDIEQICQWPTRDNCITSVYSYGQRRLPNHACGGIYLFLWFNETRIREWFHEEFGLFSPLATTIHVYHSEQDQRALGETPHHRFWFISERTFRDTHRIPLDGHQQEMHSFLHSLFCIIHSVLLFPHSLQAWRMDSFVHSHGVITHDRPLSRE